MLTLRVDGALISYQVWGDESGPWVTLVNGHTRSWTDFRAMARVLVAEGFRVLGFDNRGAGASAESRSFSLEEMVADIIRLWDHEKIDESHLLGISMGGVLAQLCCQRAADRVSKLVLVSTFLPGAALPPRGPIGGHDLESVTRSLLPNFSAGFARKNWLLIESMAKQILKHDTDPEVFSARAAMQRNALETASTWIIDPGKYKMPVRLYHGTSDEVVPFVEGQRLAASIPGAQLISYEGAGHLLIAELGRGFYDDVANFLKS